MKKRLLVIPLIAIGLTASAVYWHMLHPTGYIYKFVAARPIPSHKVGGLRFPTIHLTSRPFIP